MHPWFRLNSYISQSVQNINQLPHTAVVAPVEAERDAREIEVIIVLTLFQRRFDALDRQADDDVGDLRFVVSAAFEFDEFLNAMLLLRVRRRPVWLVVHARRA